VLVLCASACGGKSAAVEQRREPHRDDAGVVRATRADARAPAPSPTQPDASVVDSGATPDEPPGEATPVQPEGSTEDPNPEPAPSPAVSEPVPVAPSVPAEANCAVSAVPSAEPGQLAEGLARALWGETPDARLLEAAESGTLATSEGLEAEVRRLLAHPRAARRLSEFGHWWLGPRDGSEFELNKDPEAFPEFDSALASAIEQEAAVFLEQLLGDERATLGTLLGADFTWSNGALGALYDVDVYG
jgi:hypothetical protein